MTCLFWWILLTGCTGIGNPYKDADAMRQDLLRWTPIGSTMPEVEAKLRKKHVEIRVNSTRGFLQRTDRTVVGKMSIEARLAGYRSSLLSTTTVTAFWGFD